ncbi:AMP-binding protein, partial [Lysobacter maris]
LDRPELTAERFIANPYRPGERLYRTGDRMRYRSDGQLEYLGRNDDQVKIRGFRIETGEIDAMLATLDGVDAALTVVHSDSTRGARLVSYVASSDGGADTGTWMRALRDRLPEYMIPASIQLLAGLPLSANGKIDRAALPELEPHPVVHIDPETATERALAEVWKNVLGLPAVSATASFFELGGHSLLAARLVAGVQRDMGVGLPLAEIFRRQTIREQAALIDDQGDRPLDSFKTSSDLSASGLLALAEGDGTAPLILIHPVGGDAHCYAELAAKLDYPGSIHGVQAVDDGPDDIKSMAADYLSRLKPLVRSNVWRLLGWSMGGSVAFEMARQLQEQGERVEQLILLDSFHPDLVVERKGDRIDDASVLAAMAAEMGMHYAPVSGRVGQDEAGLVRDFMRAGIAQGRLDAGIGGEEIARRLRICRRNSHALRHYRPEPYDGELFLVRAEENTHPATDLGWERTASVVRVNNVGGNHGSMLRQPHVDELAAALSRRLRSGARSTSSVHETKGEVQEHGH